MKKLVAVLCIAAFGFSFTSCTKECECVTTTDGKVVGTVSSGNLKKKDCEALSVSVGNTKTECNSK